MIANVEVTKIRRFMSKREKQDLRAFLLFISPWIIGFLLFTLGPLIATFIFSFTDYNAITKPIWNAGHNYREMVTTDLFWQSLKVTGTYIALFVPCSVIGAFLLALLLNNKLPLLGMWRTIFYLPVVTSGVAVSMLWMWIFQPTFGLVNVVLFQFFGIKGPEWFFAENSAIPATVIMGLWGIGAQMLIYLAGLQSVPTQLYEAAEIDGAGSIRKFTNITVPIMTPVIFYNLVIGIINSFQIFIPAFIITQGGPNYATYFYVLYLYKNAFENYRFGYASTLAWILFLLILGITFILFKFSKSWVYEEGNDK